jgi:predicted transport protein
MTTSWTCPKCNRRFTRKNQRHACGTGEGENVLRDRPPALVSLYASIEAFANSLGQVEFVTRDRYVLMRSNRIFADLVVMSDALRLAIHLPREVKNPLFIKVAADGKHVTHVAKIHSREEFETLKPLLRDAYEFSIA